LKEKNPNHWHFIRNPKETKVQNIRAIMDYVNIINESIQAVFTLISVFTYFMLAMPETEDNPSLQNSIENLDIVCCVVVIPDMVKGYLEASKKYFFDL
jgi:hypothetical protein